MGEALETTREGQSIRLGPLAESLGFLLRLAQLRSFEDFFANLSDKDVRPGEMSVMLVIHDNPGIRQGVVARALDIKRAHMAKMARTLEDAGLIARSVPEDDKRAMELRLTEKGEAHLAELRPAFDRHEASDVSGLTPAEAEQLRTLLRKYLRIEDGGRIA
ncbi:MarR family winged helix-turn-helix transcriptional regulator [Allosediminivita pacifica]|uniref:MarR family transcriptional regulator n=1 Tax=Allosediminivita pacifica TaxID=1267769 RepID=A0A2T6AUI2_9RHOB|nr:MarR family transcriptional regulator [Allosediminivita pacifica]PTX47467.1 MarR family transcriptional regulator [Allosediminivita pacifica]GGB14419.1 MarR family transcriptional regulator [Allosediminivita pacifica]